jgi:propanediol dehydratase large subunit
VGKEAVAMGVGMVGVQGIQDRSVAEHAHTSAVYSLLEEMLAQGLVA